MKVIYSFYKICETCKFISYECCVYSVYYLKFNQVHKSSKYAEWHTLSTWELTNDCNQRVTQIAVEARLFLIAFLNLHFTNGLVFMTCSTVIFKSTWYKLFISARETCVSDSYNCMYYA